MTNEETRGFEHRELKGITVKNIIVTVISTATIVVSVMTTYFGIKAEIEKNQYQQEEYNRINDIRLKTIEQRQDIMEKEIQDLQNKVK